MKRILFTLYAGMFVFVAATADLRAQATAQITGTVKDQSGAVLPGVEVTVTQTETAASRTAVTNETGSYVLSNLPIGPYRLEAGLPGFRTYAQTGIVLQVNGSPVINPYLKSARSQSRSKYRRMRRRSRRGPSVSVQSSRSSHPRTAAQWPQRDRFGRNHLEQRRQLRQSTAVSAIRSLEAMFPLRAE